MGREQKKKFRDPDRGCAKCVSVLGRFRFEPSSPSVYAAICTGEYAAPFPVILYSRRFSPRTFGTTLGELYTLLRACVPAGAASRASPSQTPGFGPI